MADMPFIDVRVGDLIYSHNRVWVVSAVYLEGEAAATVGQLGQLAVRYPSDGAPLERAFLNISSVTPDMVYRRITV